MDCYLLNALEYGFIEWVLLEIDFKAIYWEKPKLLFLVYKWIIQFKQMIYWIYYFYSLSEIFERVGMHF